MGAVIDIGFIRARQRLDGQHPEPDNTRSMEQVFRAVDEVTTGKVVMGAVARALEKGRREIAMFKVDGQWDEMPLAEALTLELYGLVREINDPDLSDGIRNFVAVADGPVTTGVLRRVQ